jgi:hypothetical protein
MAATIDHLSSHYRVKVIQAFTDARGLDVPVGAEGVIRMIEIDWVKKEIFIDWERAPEKPGGALERLTFPLDATSGPRNNHMREYFERGELELPPREPKPSPPPEAKEDARPKRPAQRLDSYKGGQPGGEVLLNELMVACDCGPGFHRQVYPAGRHNVSACLRCGACTVTRTVGDDGRFTGDAWTAYWTVPTSQALVDWLACFPRVSINYGGAKWRWPMSAALARYPTRFYHADVRVGTLEELATLDAELDRLQAEHSRADNLRGACGDLPPQPRDLTEDFYGFGHIENALRQTPDSDLDLLQLLARLGAPACELAADLLLKRMDATNLIDEWIRSPNPDTFSSGIAMLRDARPVYSGPDDPRLAPELLGILDALSLDKLRDVPDRVVSWNRFECLLVAIADLGIGTPQMQDGLKAVMRKVARKDPHVVDAIRIVLNELNGIDNRPAQYR